MRPARLDPKEEQEDGFGGEAPEYHQARPDHQLVHQACDVVDQLGRRNREEMAKESARKL